MCAVCSCADTAVVQCWYIYHESTMNTYALWPQLLSWETTNACSYHLSADQAAFHCMSTVINILCVRNYGAVISSQHLVLSSTLMYWT